MKFVKPKTNETFMITSAPDWPNIAFETDEAGPHTWYWTLSWHTFQKSGMEATLNNKWDARTALTNYGGTLTVRAEANKHIAIISVNIRGTNPSGIDVTRYLATKPNSAGFDKILSQESHFTHFKNNEPIKSFDNGYGMCQLTSPPPAFDQVWNWRLNIDAGLKLFEQKRLSAVSYLAQSKRSYTAEQLKYETVCRWNGGTYHEWDAKAGKWVRHPNILCDSRTGNIGWDMNDQQNKGKTETELRKRDSGSYSKAPGTVPTGNTLESVMRTMFFASTLLTVFACIASGALQAQETVISPARTSIRYSARNSRTRFVIRNRAGKYYSLVVTRDSTVSPTAAPSSVQVLGEIQGSLMIITDTYPSIPGGMSYCQAGGERFLRVISFATKRPVETVKLKIESCRDSLELASEGIDWQPQSLSLRVNWLTGPAASGAPESRTINLTRQGRPR